MDKDTHTHKDADTVTLHHGRRLQSGPLQKAQMLASQTKTHPIVTLLHYYTLLKSEPCMTAI